MNFQYDDPQLEVHMTKKQKFEIKMDLIKHEILVLNEKMNSLTSNLWKIRQIALGIWLAAFGVGLGALNQIGKTNPILLFISFNAPNLVLGH